jgi:acylphosphatase
MFSFHFTQLSNVIQLINGNPSVTPRNLHHRRIFPQRKTICRAAKNIAPRRQLWLHLAVPIQTPAANRRRMKVFYSGRVQGVGFRYTARKVAAGFEIAGCVRNLPDGRVELVAEGEDAELEAFRDAIRSAVLAGFIRDESVEWDDAQNEFGGFEITQ